MILGYVTARFGKKKLRSFSCRNLKVSESLRRSLGKGRDCQMSWAHVYLIQLQDFWWWRQFLQYFRTLAMRNFSLVSNLNLPCCTWADFALPTKDMKCSRIWTLVSYLLPQSPSGLWNERSHFIPSFIEINTVKSSDHPHEWSQISSP